MEYLVIAIAIIIILFWLFQRTDRSDIGMDLDNNIQENSNQFKIVKIYHERKTYINGNFVGKFIGYFDPDKSDILHENFYDLEVVSGEIYTNRNNIKSWVNGESPDFVKVEKFLTKLPEIVNCNVEYDEGVTKNFTIHLNEPKLKNYIISKQLYDKNNVYGDIDGDISGYIKHFDVEERVVPIDDLSLQPAPVRIRTDRPTGNIEINGKYKRFEYYYNDNTTYWGDWIYNPVNSKGNSSFSLIWRIIQYVLLFIFLIPFLVIGWRLFLPLLIIAVIFYTFSFLKPLLLRFGNILFYTLTLGLVLLMFSGLISYITEPTPKVKKKIPNKEEKEVSSIDTETALYPDSIISHYLQWYDYENKLYSGFLKVKVSDYLNAKELRETINLPFNKTSHYNNLVAILENNERNNLSMVYQLLDSLRTSNSLNDFAFAEMITSCIQTIPYTLLVDNACNFTFYNDQFVIEHIRGGGKCRGFVKYGILSPSEFVGTLDGDCDTRTLLLFKILDYYGYDVAMLGSEVYKHSILGINLPYRGHSKIINGRRYVLWETTSKDFKPGIISPEISDERFWHVNLISKNQPI